MSPARRGALDRARPPEPGRRHRFDFPRFERLPTAHGVELLLAPLPGRGLVQLELICPGGAQHETAAEGGLATLAAALLDEGTSTADALEIARRVEVTGGALGTSADWDAVYFSAGVASEQSERALALVAELASDASFPEHEFSRLQRQRRAELQRRAAQPGYLAAVRLAEAVYGEAPYGHSLLGSDASVAGLDRERVCRYARRHVGPRGATLVAVGDLDAEAFAARCAALLETWTGTAAPEEAAAPPAPATERPIWIVDRPGAGQTELRCGQVGIPRRHADFAPLQLLSSILGGKFTSRLNLSLRERHGITYGAYSRVSGRRGAGPIVLGAAVATEATGLAAGEMLAELERLRQEPVAVDELGEARDYLLGVFPYTLQTVGGLGRRLETLAVHSLPDDYWAGYLERIESAVPEDLLACARRHLRPDTAALVAVGPAAELAPQLEPHGPLRVVPATAA